MMRLPNVRPIGLALIALVLLVRVPAFETSGHAQLHPYGEWAAVPFNAAHYTANAGTWTVESGDVLLYRYMLIGKTLWIALNVQATTTSAGMGNELRIQLPGGLQAINKEFTGPLPFISGGGIGPTRGYVVTRDGGSGGANKIALFKSDSSAWPDSRTNDLGVRFVAALEVQ